MQVEIWSDVVCPWCYIGKRRFEAALARFPHAGEVVVRWRSFELDPSAPASREGSYEERLAEKYRVPVEQAATMTRQMTEAAAGDGLDFHFERARPGNTVDAHRLLHLAVEHGVQDAVKERLLLATFTEGEPIADREALVRLVGEAGLDEAAARRVLDSNAYLDEVRADEAEAIALGISGVPFFVVDRKYGVSGAQSADVLLQVLERAWSDAPKLSVVGAGAGLAEGCEGDSCAV